LDEKVLVKKIQEVSSEQFKIVLDKLSSEFLGKKFKLAEGFKTKYDEYIAHMKTECEHLKKNGQACKKEQDFLNNTKKVFEVLEKSKEPVGKEELESVIQSSNIYLYVVLLNLEKKRIIEQV